MTRAFGLKRVPPLSRVPKSRRLRAAIGALTVILMLLCCPGAIAAEPTPPFQQLTRGPKHHFFGYIGQCRTIPWSGDGRHLLALQTPVLDRMPGPNDAAEIVLLDIHADHRVRVADRSRAWNPQQGTMLYWNPRQPSAQFLFNDRDPKSGKVFAVLYDISKGRRLREYRFEDTPAANSGVAQGGGWFCAINYGRLARLRPVTGYPGAYDWTVGQPAPANDGIFRIDIETGQKQLIVSFAQLKEKLRGLDPGIEHRHLFINHTLVNRDSDRIYFYCRADFEAEPESKRLNVPFTVKPDGTELTAQRVFIGGHPDWAEGVEIIGAKDKQQVVYNVLTQQLVRALGGTSMFPNPGGDIAVSPDGRWLVNGHSDKAGNAYTCLELTTGRVLKSPSLPVGKWSSKELRLDPAPCWNRSRRTSSPAMSAPSPRRGR